VVSSTRAWTKVRTIRASVRLRELARPGETEEGGGGDDDDAATDAVGRGSRSGPVGRPRVSPGDLGTSARDGRAVGGQWNAFAATGPR
jgi:hypothetical protein